MKNALFIKLAVLAATLSLSFTMSFAQVHRANNAESAKQFVESLYAGYGSNSDPPNLFEKNAKDVFDPTLISLARADADAARPDVGALDYDPICNCQDPDGTFPNIKIVIRSAEAAHALVIVTFSGYDAPNKIALTLLKRRDQWRIFNIEDLSGPGPHTDLRTLLKNDIRNLTREHEKSYRR
jgi:hypothetical protein